MFDTKDIIETISMIREECLDIRTITMGISLYDCQSEDADRLCTRIYDRIMSRARNLVKTGEDIEKKYGIPIINKRVSVTPVALMAGGLSVDGAVKVARTLDKAAHELGINFIGGYSALVQKGFTNGSRTLISSIPQALAETERVCSSVNVASTKAGNRGPYKGPSIHRMRKAGDLRERSGRQSVYGGRVPRDRRTGNGDQRRCLRAGSGCLRNPPERSLQPDGSGGNNQADRIQNHAGRSARGAGSFRTARRAVRNRGSFPCPDSGGGRLCRLYSGIHGT